MDWYYADKGTQQGPFDDAVFADLVRQGRVTADTLVWKTGMASWVRYAELQSDAGQATGAAATEGSGTQLVTCASCGGTFSEQDVMRFEDRYVCATCKPAFTQQLREGVQLAGTAQFAGFWVRVLASIIDGVIIGLFNGFLQIGVSGMTSSVADDPDAAMLVMATSVGLTLVSITIAALYEIILTVKYGATVGKMALKLRVVTADGQGLRYGRSTGRHFAKWVSQMIAFIGYIMVGFDKEKRGLHDMMCNTRVIRI